MSNKFGELAKDSYKLISANFKFANLYCVHYDIILYLAHDLFKFLDMQQAYLSIQKLG